MPDASTLLAIAIGLALGTALATIASYLRRQSRRGIRPAGAALIAAFQLGLGFVLLLMLTMLIWFAAVDFDRLRDQFKDQAAKPEGFILSVLVMCALSLAGGIGLWRGTRWGWHIVVFAVACGIVRNLLSMLLDPVAVQELGQSLAFFYSQHLFRAGLNAIMLAYLYRAGVLRFCSLTLSRRAHIRSLFASVLLAIALEMIERQLNR
jgi:hypothetical protein